MIVTYSARKIDNQNSEQMSDFLRPLSKCKPSTQVTCSLSTLLLIKTWQFLDVCPWASLVRGELAHSSNSESQGYVQGKRIAGVSLLSRKPDVSWLRL